MNLVRPILLYVPLTFETGSKGRPYGKKGRRGMMWEGEGRFANRPYGGGDGFPPTVFTEGRLCAGITEEAGMTWGTGSEL